jgi:hypothetical protein
MQYRPDLEISDRFGTPIALVEVKALKGDSAQAAARYLRNLLAHGVAPLAPFVSVSQTLTHHVVPTRPGFCNGLLGLETAKGPSQSLDLSGCSDEF